MSVSKSVLYGFWTISESGCCSCDMMKAVCFHAVYETVNGVLSSYAQPLSTCEGVHAYIQE